MNDHTTPQESSKANRLASEKSPYLLQHAYNPVDWYPWTNEAFQKAKTENKPIFLSIGYSSCHWCHVMAHESFEDREVAKFLNENFVNIKVDREERPDVDEVYMKAVMSMTGSGGWPLTVFLTPSLEPIFGGTYFPPAPRYGTPSFINVAKGVADSWRTDRKNMVESAKQLKGALAQLYDFKKKGQESILDEGILGECYSSLATSFDQTNGGFGVAPKFPMPSNLFFLMRYSKLKQSKLALSMVTKTLDAMMSGGIYDHIGGGFHRYSTDRYWLVPHFEKMLYDNALLITVYTEAFLITKNREYARVAREIITWAIREMRFRDGGFFSAQDADSPDGEGSYYVWNPKDAQDALRNSKISNPDIILKYFSITSEGNFDDGKTVLTTKPIGSTAGALDLDVNELQNILEDSKKGMLEYRNKRPKPSTDDKIITSWNGLMITALSKAYSAFGDEVYLSEAQATAESILSRRQAVDGQITLSRSFRDGEERGDGVLEDYSFFTNGLIDLYEASFDAKYLKTAISLAETMISKFQDTNGGGFFFTDATAKNLIVRPKDGYDGAIPSGNSLAALTLARLAEFTNREDFRNAAENTLEAFWATIFNQPESFSEMLVALQFLVGTPKEIVISGNPVSQETKELVDVLRSAFLPNCVKILADKELESVTPLVHGRIPSPSDKPRAFVCTNFTCKLPTNSRDQLREMLDDQANLGQ